MVMASVELALWLKIFGALDSSHGPERPLSLRVYMSHLWYFGDFDTPDSQEQ
jgi:hypothetical protein